MRTMPIHSNRKPGPARRGAGSCHRLVGSQRGNGGGARVRLLGTSPTTTPAERSRGLGSGRGEESCLRTGASGFWLGDRSGPRKIGAELLARDRAVCQRLNLNAPLQRHNAALAPAADRWRSDTQCGSQAILVFEVVASAVECIHAKSFSAQLKRESSAELKRAHLVTG